MLLRILFLVLAAWGSMAGEVTGKVVRVIDADTIVVLDGANTQQKIRLTDIDAPERSQAYGNKARQALSGKIFGKTVKVTYDGSDRYGRILGRVDYNGRWINKELVAEGWAWLYRQYSSDQNLAAAETAARQQHLGLWADPHPVAPWEYRHGSKTTTAPATTTADQAAYQAYWLNTATNVRHNPGCRHYKKTKQGRPCSPTEGKPCGLCGG